MLYRENELIIEWSNNDMRWGTHLLSSQINDC